MIDKIRSKVPDSFVVPMLASVLVTAAGSYYLSEPTWVAVLVIGIYLLYHLLVPRPDYCLVKLHLQRLMFRCFDELDKLERERGFPLDDDEYVLQHAGIRKDVEDTLQLLDDLDQSPSVLVEFAARDVFPEHDARYFVFLKMHLRKSKRLRVPRYAQLYNSL